MSQETLFLAALLPLHRVDQGNNDDTDHSQNAGKTLEISHVSQGLTRPYLSHISRTHVYQFIPYQNAKTLVCPLLRTYNA
jgi:hypothetical protein